MTPSAAKAMCREVCRHYGLSREATKQAVESATMRPAQAGQCYKAILTSLKPLAPLIAPHNEV